MKSKNLFFVTIALILNLTFFSQGLLNIIGVAGNTSVSSNSIITTTSFKSSISSQNILPIYSNNNSWLELGPKPLLSNILFGQGPKDSGRITSLVVNQSNPEIIYVGSAQGGVWRTINGGKTWKPLMDNQQSLAIGSITISADQKTIFVGTGESNGGMYAGNGILKTTNEGNSWQILGSNIFANSSISGIVINQTNPNWIVASTSIGSCCHNLKSEYNSHGMGIFYSENGEKTWNESNIIGNYNNTYIGIAQVIPDPVNYKIIFATDFFGRIWESNDSGQFWARMNISSSSTNPTRSAIGISKNNPDLLYIALTDSNKLVDILRYNLINESVNAIPNLPGGANSPCGNQCNYDLVMAVDPVNPNILYFGGVTLYRSTNAGISWTSISIDASGAIGYIHSDFHALVFSHSNIYIGSDGGVFSSTDTGTTWNNLNSDLGITQFYNIAASPANDSIIMGGTQDNGCDAYANNTSWNLVQGGDGGSTLFLNDTTVICINDNYNNGLKLSVSYNGGQRWVSSYNGINTNDNHLFLPPMAQNYLDKSVIYIGSTNLYKSTNFGSNWDVVTGLQNSSPISKITLSSSNPNVIAISKKAGQVKITNNGGTTWKTILDIATMFPNYHDISSYYTSIPISSLAIDPLNSNHLFVSLENNMNPKLLETTNGGSTWQVLQTLGQIPANDSINVMKYNPISKTLFLGTDCGMYYYNGTNFYALGSNLPNSAIFDLTFTHSSYLLAATFGRGVWFNYMTPDATLKGVTNSTFTSQGTKFNLTVTDPNGFSKASYNWENSNNQSFSSTVTLTVPSNKTNLQLNVYALDAAGNRMHTLFIFNPKNTQNNTHGFNVPIVIITFGVIAIIYTKIRKKKI